MCCYVFCVPKFQIDMSLELWTGSRWWGTTLLGIWVRPTTSEWCRHQQPACTRSHLQQQLLKHQQQKQQQLKQPKQQQEKKITWKRKQPDYVKEYQTIMWTHTNTSNNNNISTSTHYHNRATTTRSTWMCSSCL